MITNLTIFSAVAWAADVEPAAQGAAGSPMSMLLPFVAIFAVMYFLMIRPQQKRQKEHQAMLASIDKGDKILTNGGIIGKVTGIDKESGELTIEIAPQVRVKLARGYVTKVFRPGAANQAAPAAPPAENN